MKKMIIFLDLYLTRRSTSSDDFLSASHSKYSRCRPDGVFEVEGFDNGSSDEFISARTSILTGFLNPALESSLTASVCVAEKRPVLRIFGNRDIIEFIWLSNPISKSLSASSRIKTSRLRKSSISMRSMMSNNLPGVPINTFAPSSSIFLISFLTSLPPTRSTGLTFASVKMKGRATLCI
uniref:Uncharacterized protein n=1 Tax=Opuntia streptacantha TaxID=393608 RepID=A0A7C8YGL6_OPUST